MVTLLYSQVYNELLATHEYKVNEMIEKILVALDGSQASANALGLALDIASKYSADLILISVIPPAPAPMVSYSPTGYTPINPISIGQYYTQMKNRLAEVLSESHKKVTELKPSLKVTTKLLDGRIADQIVKAGKDEAVDLIVLGHQGTGSIKGLILGSVSDRVADNAHRSVLIVK
jgi:nucleotide-binding universal stress UspA family protein